MSVRVDVNDEGEFQVMHYIPVKPSETVSCNSPKEAANLVEKYCKQEQDAVIREIRREAAVNVR